MYILYVYMYIKNKDKNVLICQCIKDNLRKKKKIIVILMSISCLYMKNVYINAVKADIKYRVIYLCKYKLFCRMTHTML